MRVESLEITNFRCIDTAGFRPAAELNVIYGGNGSGKTSLLEALHVLCLAKSFRSQRARDIVRHGTRQLMVTGNVQGRDGAVIHVGVQKDGTGTQIRYDGETVFQTSFLAQKLPVVLVTPDSHVNLFSSPIERRRIIDMTLFHVKPNYFEIWKRFIRCLRQRNQLLRDRQHFSRIEAWDKQLIQTAIPVHYARRECIERLAVLTRRFLTTPLRDGLAFQYRPGWDEGVGLETILRQAMQIDIEQGYTRFGPQRADLQIHSGGFAVDRCFSRGQLKLITTALLLAQARYVVEETGTSPLILIDDLVSDLDLGARKALVDALLILKSQVFMTTIDPEIVPFSDRSTLFHVEHGTIRQAA